MDLTLTAGLILEHFGKGEFRIYTQNASPFMRLGGFRQIAPALNIKYPLFGDADIFTKLNGRQTGRQSCCL
ncbi:MAG: hypothetical protein A2498_00855 [Lentisphaerae bacterium RIFOXYC12_FULL_60_16]|nr:MAG: hypothetical protein A2498_00855 [Lentisphaerae bacterium RIFOXYC12_FULL_60_16]OGV76274.1 MAG: hypothetical protein A2340_08830 [Lentisphaerae bacterium RIFOXYB12_FULL_60_10]